MDETMKEVIAGGAKIFAGTAAASVAGLLFWFVIGRLSGLSAIGEASTVISTAQMASFLLSAGIGTAALREAAARREASVLPSLLLATAMGVLSAIASVALLMVIGWVSFIPIVSLITFFSVVSRPSAYLLIGLERFKAFFLVQLTGSLTKLVLGADLALLGFSVWAVFAGFLAHPAIVFLGALAIFFVHLSTSTPDWGYVKDVLLLSLSNYPFSISNQLIVPLSVYLYSVIGGEVPSTGVLYISLMIMVVTASLSISLINASLPIGIRRGTNPIGDALIVGLALSAPLLSAAIVVSDKVISLINPGMAPWSGVLRLLLLATVPYAVITATIIDLNREKRIKEILLIGGTRLALLLVSMTPAIGLLGVEGASTAFLLANAVLMPYAGKLIGIAPKDVAVIWVPQAASLLIAAVSPTILIAALAAATSALLLHASGVLRLKDIARILSAVLTH